MRLLSTRIRPNNIPKHNNKGNEVLKPKIQMSTKTTRNEVAKHKNECQ